MSKLLEAATVFCMSFISTAALAWSTGIGIIDNNVPKVIKDPSVVYKDPIGAITDLAAKGGCYRCDVLVEQAIPERQRQIANAVITTGFVTRPLGPVGDLVTLSVLVAAAKNTEVQGKDVPVRVKENEAPKHAYNATADCIVQRPGKLIDVYSINPISNVSAFRKDDTIVLKAKHICPEYNVADTQSVSSAIILFGGASEDLTAIPGKEFKYYIVGRIKT